MIRRGRVALRPPGGLAPLALVGLLGILVVVDHFVETDVLSMANPDPTRASQASAALAALPPQPLVLVGMDADLGTYPEIRPVVRGLLAEVLARDGRVAFVSFTPDGRALAAAEAERLVRGGAPPESILDIGFVPGAEAGLVLAVTDLLPTEVGGLLAADIRGAGDGIAAFDAAVVVGGVDFGPRGWVEQVATRLPALPLIAVAPTFAHPELAPYLRTGQLDALLATTRDDSAYLEARGEGDTPGPAADAGPGPIPMLIGMLAALAVIARSVAMPGPPPGPRGPTPDEEAA